MPYKTRHTEELLKGRISIPGAIYFLTWVTDKRNPLFADETTRLTARKQVAAINDTGDGCVLAGTVMPDHFHLLLELGTSLSLSAVIAKTKAAITRACPGTKWQINYFDCRLRPIDSAEDYAFYIFMNPYCAELIPLTQSWSGWIPSRNVRWRFEEKLLPDGLPPAAWLNTARRFSAGLPPGAH